jgi:glutathione-regulated potassium-efflux system ancillary protein KefC/glutathione-regulated potassium-efflux system protein KefB
MAADGNTSQLVGIVTLLGAAVVGVPLFKRLGLGAVLGYLAAGLVIGPFGMGLLTDAQTIIHVAELGVVMFLFVIGLEMKPSSVGPARADLRPGQHAGGAVGPAADRGGGVVGFPWQVAFVSGAGFVLTSTAIVMQVLAERGDLMRHRASASCPFCCLRIC